MSASKQSPGMGARPAVLDVGEAYLKRGDTGKAIVSFESLELNPDNANARQFIQRLKANGE